MLHRIVLLFSFISMLSLIACSDSSDTNSGMQYDTKNDTHQLQVAVVNYPLQFFAEQIGGENISVYFPVDDEDPAYWQPDNSAILNYQKADVIFLNGAGYAKWIQYATLPEDKLINTSSAFTERLMVIEDDMKHNHGPKGDHSHGTLAFTTWLDMQLAIQHAIAIRDTLITLQPVYKDQFNKNAQTLIAQLKSIDQQLNELGQKLQNTPVIFSHPVYQYFQRAYQLNGIDVHWEPDVFPNEQAFQSLVERNREHGAKWMIWEGKPLLETVNKLQALGIQSIVFNPISTRSKQGNFLDIMTNNGNQLDRLMQNIE